MLNHSSHFRWIIGVSLVFVGVVRSALAADHGAVLEPYLSDDTFAVGYVDLALLSVTGDHSDLRPLLQLLPDPSREPYGTAIHALAGAISSLQSAGAQSAYVIAGLNDIHAGGAPIVMVTVAPDKSLDGVEQLLKLAVEQVGVFGALRKELVVERSEQAVIVGTRSALSRDAAEGAAPRADLAGSLATLADEGAKLAIVFSPGSDLRRVVRELWPKLPGPLAPLRGELADRWLRLEFSAKTQAEVGAQLTMQTTDAESATLFAQLLGELPAACEQMEELGKRRHELSRTMRTIIDAVPTRVDGSQVVMTLPTEASQLEKLRGLASDAMEAALESTRRNERMNRFKQLALAMLNYTDRNKHLPPAAIRDEEGQPLLSWRVAILPWVEEQKLYNQFHLNEPWDSPHNRTLIDKMPEIYAEPSPRLRRMIGEHKTTYVVPAGPGTVFDRSEGTTFKEITDGTSKTIMIVEVPPERAVVWTKPEDWAVDLENPLRGVKRSDRDYFIAAWCDGSVQIIRTNADPDKFRAALTRAGQEVVDRP